MKFKERGITVGDLFLILIFTILISFIINKAKESNKQSYFHIDRKEIIKIKSPNH